MFISFFYALKFRLIFLLKSNVTLSWI